MSQKFEAIARNPKDFSLDSKNFIGLMLTSAHLMKFLVGYIKNLKGRILKYTFSLKRITLDLRI